MVHQARFYHSVANHLRSLLDIDGLWRATKYSVRPLRSRYADLGQIVAALATIPDLIPHKPVQPVIFVPGYPDQLAAPRPTMWLLARPRRQVATA